MREHIVTAVLLMSLLTGCSKHHIAIFVNPDLDRLSTRIEIEHCLSNPGMRDVSRFWPYAEYIAESPKDVIAIWKVPPPTFDSFWERCNHTPSGHGTAWIRPHQGIYRVSFHKHDYSLPEKFRICVAEAIPNSEVVIESGWTMDLS